MTKVHFLAFQEAIDRLKEKIDLIEKQLDLKKVRSGVLKIRFEIFATQTIPSLQNGISEIHNELDVLFEIHWLENIGLPRYEKESFSKSPAELSGIFMLRF